MKRIFSFDELQATVHAREFVGSEHDDVPFSLILVNAPPGVGPRLHQHPYPEVFIVESGRASFRLGEDSFRVDEGHVVVGPPNTPHGFINDGDGMLRLIAVRGSGIFQTEWLDRGEGQWTDES